MFLFRLNRNVSKFINTNFLTQGIFHIYYLKISEEKTEKEYVLCGKYNCSMMLQMQEQALLLITHQYILGE